MSAHRFRRTRPSDDVTSAPAPARRGVSIVEVLVGITIFAVGLLGLAQAASIGLAQATHARDDMTYTADLQQVADSLINLGYGKVATGSAVVRGRTIAWTLTTPGTNAQLLRIVAPRRGEQRRAAVAAADTLSLYLAKSTPGS